MQVTVELKNDLAITGTMHSVDQYLNIKLNNTRVVNEQKYPHMVRMLLQAPVACWDGGSFAMPACLKLIFASADVGQELLHQRIRREICPGMCSHLHLTHINPVQAAGPSASNN